MRGRNVLASASFGAPGTRPKAPPRFQIWRPGENRGDFGVTILTPEAADRVIAAYLARGNLLPIDIEHGTNPRANPNYDPAKPPPGGGYLALQRVDTDRGPAIWADPVRWSDYARAQIEGGERCYISPDWDNDPETKQPLRINKVSLVMNPGTYGMPLLASRDAAAPAFTRVVVRDPRFPNISIL